MKRTETEFLLGLIAIVIVLLVIVWYLMTYGLPARSNGTYRVREYQTTTSVTPRSSNSYNTTGYTGSSTSYQTQTVQTSETTTSQPGTIIIP